MPTAVEILKSKLYDTLFLPENLVKGKGHLFAVPIGQYAGRKIKSWEHTNLLCAGAMDAPRSFVMRQVRCAFYQGGEFISPMAGVLRFQQLGKSAKAFNLESITSEGCKSYICEPDWIPSRDYLKREDEDHPCICELKSQEWFGFELELERDPDIPTEFVLVLLGDLWRPAALCQNASA